MPRRPILEIIRLYEDGYLSQGELLCELGQNVRSYDDVLATLAALLDLDPNLEQDFKQCWLDPKREEPRRYVVAGYPGGLVDFSKEANRALDAWMNIHGRARWPGPSAG